ncbi:hypothetical protein PGT21_004397 [Puccinia graminis f. sp. tritici]|uniref:RING-type E3 ubiquitin transferase n=1 Tax=Puccinia graminis f. sp. tritici TaxID=56615 RepID=A0A5B0NB32_PUCGR|nr:hypothetical protein PGTUg99_004634 [Puccinia graminis f. sp. tritici]KAA1089033.1 hypothetical protein PGT21_004759 [Puccinia graminis f. sp. tritici]KAA1092478.1 hypothetical protein PGT21_004397 [Puccinia graminis f. sp. tritici]KAA1127681.1 hypothetical protein PGTUg99_003866 [Puccinia graminis f. sp. tritici]
MSRSPVASRNPFVPPPNTVTFSAASWSSQGLTFNVLFSIMDRSRGFPVEQDFQSTSPDSLWPISDQPWASTSSDTASSPNGPEPTESQHNIDQVLNSIGQALSAFSLSLQHAITNCGMCLEDYKANDQVLVLPCHPSHFFHRHCLRDWFKEYLNCPMCRKKFGPP